MEAERSCTSNRGVCGLIAGFAIVLQIVGKSISIAVSDLRMMLDWPLLHPSKIEDELSNRRFGQTLVLEKRKHVQPFGVSSYKDFIRKAVL